MKQKMHHWWKALLGGLLTLLGFGFSTACRNEYGCPNASFKVLGDVKNTRDKAVQGIRVVFVPEGNPDEPSWENDTLYTDSRGHFEVQHTRYSWPDSNRMIMVVEDVDGAANGSYERQVVHRENIVVRQVEEGSGNWYEGGFEVSAQIVLEDKTEE